MTLQGSFLRRDAYWLPGLREEEVERWATLSFGPNEPDQGRLEIRAPLLTAAGLKAVMQRIVEAREGYLCNLPVWRIVDLLDRVGSRWLDPTSPYRREAERLLPTITGYAEPAVRKGLPALLACLRKESLRRLIEQEMQDPLVLDGFRAMGSGGGEIRAFGPPLTVHVWSGNVPGLPVQSLINALLVKSACLGKVASEEPMFATLLAESIAEVDPRLASCLAVTWWPGGYEPLEQAAFERAGAVIAYGGEQTIASIEARVPRSVRLVKYGHKLSFGVIGREAVTAALIEETADQAAYDVSKYDQQGCLSPHLFYVESGGERSPRAFAGALAGALARYEKAVPRGRLSLSESSAVIAARQRIEVQQAAGGAAALLQDGTGAGGWAVLYDEDPAFQPSCLNRTISVKPIQDMLAETPGRIQSVREYLQTCGVAASPHRRRDLAEALGRLGLDRICPLGRMGDAAVAWRHDGHFNLLDLLRWTNLEPEASAGRWEFAHPDLGLYGKPDSETAR